MKRTLFITGTDTAVGKTVLTTLLARGSQADGARTAALKPVCSGGRQDARDLFAALDGALSLVAINPWHFRSPVAPILAARREKKKVKLSQVIAQARAMQRRFDVLLLEGAGGLLSPLGADFNSRDVIVALRATPVIVAPDKLGTINAVLLTLEALPPAFRRRAVIVLMSPRKADAASGSNAALLAELSGPRRIVTLPWLGKQPDPARALKNSRLRKILRTIICG